MANTKIAVQDSATGVNVVFSIDQPISGTKRGDLECNINQQPTNLTDEQFRVLVDGLMDLRTVFAEVKAKVPAVKS